MRILSNSNIILDTDTVGEESFYTVLSFKDYKNPDFMCEKFNEIDVVESASIALKIGPYKLVMPLIWSVLVTDYENLECVPLHDAMGKRFEVFCVNPLDGYMPVFYPLTTGMIYPKTTWSAPPITEKDMLVIPLGYEKKDRTLPTGESVEAGPICAIFSPTRMEINKSISDIW